MDGYHMKLRSLHLKWVHLCVKFYEKILKTTARFLPEFIKDPFVTVYKVHVKYPLVKELNEDYSKKISEYRENFKRTKWIFIHKVFHDVLEGYMYDTKLTPARRDALKAFDKYFYDYLQSRKYDKMLMKNKKF